MEFPFQMERIDEFREECSSVIREICGCKIHRLIETRKISRKCNCDTKMCVRKPYLGSLEHFTQNFMLIESEYQCLHLTLIVHANPTKGKSQPHKKKHRNDIAKNE